MLGLRSIVQIESFKSVEETRGYTRTVHTRTQRALPRHIIHPMEFPIPSPPHLSVLSRLLDPVGRCLTPEVAQHLVALQVDPAVQARLEELADTCTEGQLSADERTEYATYVQALEFIAVLQAQARSLLANSHV